MKYTVGTVKELWRYPVKSMAGELVNEAQIEKLGMVGDRCWAVRDEDKNETTSVKKLPKLLLCSPEYEQQPEKGQVGDEVPHVNIILPDGTSFRSEDENKNEILSAYLKKNVSLWPLQSKKNWKFYQLKTMAGAEAMKKQFNSKEELPNLASVSWLKLLELSIFATPLGRFYDAYPLHLVTSNSIEKLKQLTPEGDFIPQRFRPNIYIESSIKNANLDEFEWVGGKLHIGNTIIKCNSRTVRCSMPAQPQPNINKDSKILRTLEKYTKRHLGINGSVIQVGSIRCGDTVYWEPEAKYALRKFYQPVSDGIRNRVIQSSLKMVDRLGSRNS